MATTTTKDARAEELIQLVSFNLGSEEFGIDILKVQEINRMVEITKVPQAPH
jgi:purine-binding chemotaxis protein CheW